MGAIISECGKYRYLLHRGDGDRTMPIVMLNPSTADATLDDPTIRRCKGFAEREGCGRLVVANLYALRATKPNDLWTADDPIGPDNDITLATLLALHGPIVCAWGANAKPDRVRWFVELAKAADAELFCLGTTKSGAPRHPLYIKADQPLVPYIHGAVK